MVASERDVETAKRLFGCDDDITTYIVSLGDTIENTTRAEVDAMHRGQWAAGRRVPPWARDGLPQGEGAEREADGHEVQPE